MLLKSQNSPLVIKESRVVMKEAFETYSLFERFSGTFLEKEILMNLPSML